MEGPTKNAVTEETVEAAPLNLDEILVTGEPIDAEPAEALPDEEDEALEVTEEPEDADEEILEVTEEPENAEPADVLPDEEDEAIEVNEEPEDADEEILEVTEEPDDAEAADVLPDEADEAIEVNEEPEDADEEILEVTEEPENAEAAEALADEEDEALEVTEEPEDADEEILEITEEPENAEPADVLPDEEEETLEVTEEPEDADAVTADTAPAKKKKSVWGLILGIVGGVIGLILVATVALFLYFTSVQAVTISPSMVSVGQDDTYTLTAVKETRMLDAAIWLAQKGADVDMLINMLNSPVTNYHKVTWASSDETVATVDKNGVVTAVSEGSCTIFATVKKGVEASVPCTVVPPLCAEEKAILGTWASTVALDTDSGDYVSCPYYTMVISSGSANLSDVYGESSYTMSWYFDSPVTDPEGNVFYCEMDGQAVLMLVHDAANDLLHVFNNSAYFIFLRDE